MKVNNRIRVVLAEQGKRSTFLIEELKVSKTTVSRWVNNKQQPSLDNLGDIARLLKVRICDLIDENDISQGTGDAQ